ncbi:MAG: hypothetical protein H6Q05_2159 [Acidobacteria bacterium]|nr:hypothetical protein [Acidobacteriota bacterium]
MENAVSWDKCLFIRPDGTEQASSNIPTAPWIEQGKLLPCEPFPYTPELIHRKVMLLLFANQLRAREGNGYTILMGDLTKAGRNALPGEEDLLKGLQENGIPNGLKQCAQCGEWRGECFDTLGPLIVRVHCVCENDNLCAACLKPLYGRKLNANYYSESDRKIWHVPGFHAIDHKCPQAVESFTSPKSSGSIQ